MKTKKKIILCLLVMLMLFTAVSVQAATSRAVRASLQLTFDGTQANCSVVITADMLTDTISATMQLKQGNTIIDSWSSSSNGFLILRETAPVEENKTYTLVVTYSINGVVRPSISSTETND